MESSAKQDRIRHGQASTGWGIKRDEGIAFWGDRGVPMRSPLWPLGGAAAPPGKPRSSPRPAPSGHAPLCKSGRRLSQWERAAAVVFIAAI